MAAGDRFAIVLRNETGECFIRRAAGGDSYLAGQAFFDARPNRAGVWFSMRDYGDPDDLPFRTLIETTVTGHENQCSVRGLDSPIPIPKFVPVCRCLQDTHLREQRCMLLHPSLMLFRRLPLSLKPGEPFTVRWTLMPLAPIEGIVEVADHLPAGFDSSLKTSLWFFADQMTPGEAITLEYSAVASAKGGAFQVNTGVTIPGSGQIPSTGSMRTMVSVLPQR
jgi:hypothetical protein